MQPTIPKYDIGSIHWLPPRNEVPLEHLHATVHIDSGCFNHPVVILWVNPLKTEAIILIITSFKGTDLLLKHPRDSRARALHVPIYPSNTHPDNGSRLFLRDGAQLRKNSYVKIEHQRTVKTVLLLPTRYGVYTLSKKSYKELVKHIDFHPPVTPSHQKTHSRHVSRDYGEWPDFVDPAVGGAVKPPPERRYVVPVQQALPAPQVQQSPRPEHVRLKIPPRQVEQPVVTPYIQYEAFMSSHTPPRQIQQTPGPQHVQQIPPQQIQQTARPEHVQQILPPRQVDQLITNSYVTYNALSSLHTPPRQNQQAPRPEHVQQTFPPRQFQQPVTFPYVQYNALSSSYTPTRQTARTPPPRPVQPVPYVTRHPHTHGIRSQASGQSCGVDDVVVSIVVIVVLSIFVWLLWRVSNA